MKKLLILATLAFVSAPMAQAGGTFGLFTCKSCSNCNVCVRPYNAFSPVCLPNIGCDGFSNSCGQGGYTNVNYIEGGPVPMGLQNAPSQIPMGNPGQGKKGAYLMPSYPSNYYPVYIQGGYPTPMQVVPYTGAPVGIPSFPTQN